MKKIITVLLLLLFFGWNFSIAGGFKISKEKLKDKIKGGWAGQTIGCSFGGPTEFNYQQTIIHDHIPIKWNEKVMKWWYDNEPGLYDDIYMDLTFVQVFEEKGLDAPAKEFALAFANADYMLWHANQAARYNILNGIMPPKSGHWLYNPHSEDIDFQIEADFAGLMSPGMPNAASEFCDTVGHLMNYGDGWYGGVYVANMYSLAFISDDVNYIVEEALKSIPQESNFYKTIADLIKWYKANPNDWHDTWFKVQMKWGEDIGCPDGVYRPFNIDAKINAAWIVMGLLYGQGDFGKTTSISTRCGDDSDCNPASAAGILGTMLGYSNIPDYWKQGLDVVEPMNFSYIEYSLNDVYEISFKHALKVIEKNGGSIENDEVTILTQKIEPVRLEIGFEGHYPKERRWIEEKEYQSVEKELTLEFEGIGYSITGGAYKKDEKSEDYIFEVEVYIDDKLVETTAVPTNYTTRKNTPFWKYQLPKGKHKLFLKILNPTEKAAMYLRNIVIYDDKPMKSKF